MLVALLSACQHQAYVDGRARAQTGDWEGATPLLKQASVADARNQEYRRAYLESAERAHVALLALARENLNQGQFDEARAVLKRVQKLDSENSRASYLAREIEREERHSKILQDVRLSVQKKQFELANDKLASVLAENPNQRVAIKLKEEIDAQVAKVPRAVNLKTAYQKPITIEFKDALLKSIFEVLSRSSGLNFIFDKDVRADLKATIFLRNSTIENAVQTLLVSNQLESRLLDDNTVLIYPNTQAKQREYQPLSVRSFYLANGDVKVVANAVKVIAKSRDVVIDEKLNLLIVRDTPDALKIVEKLVALHDLAEPEVMLEVEVLEVKRTRLMQLGVAWPGQLSLSPLVASGASLTVQALRNLGPATIGATISPVTINANKTDSNTNILANPRIRARNREKAKILIGERVPNITTTSTATGFVSESINYVDVGLKLEVEPNISLDDDVAIKVQLEVSNIVSQVQTKSGSIAYNIGTRSASTVLRLRDGENQVLAGLISDEERKSGNRVPGLGDLPLVGRLFGSESDDASKTEIVLSITPRIVRKLERPKAELLDFDSGTEAGVGKRGAGGAESSGTGNVNTSPSINPPANPNPTPARIPGGLPGGMPSTVPPNPTNAVPPATPTMPTMPAIPFNPADAARIANQNSAFPIQPSNTLGPNFMPGFVPPVSPMPPVNTNNVTPTVQPLR